MESKHDQEKVNVNTWLVNLGLFDFELFAKKEGTMIHKSRMIEKEMEMEKQNRLEIAKGHRYKYGSHNYTPKPVIKLSLMGEFISEYTSIGRAAADNAIRPSSVKKCCDGNYTRAGNHTYVYKSDYEADGTYQAKRGGHAKTPHAVVMLSLKGEYIAEYRSMTQAANNSGVDVSAVKNCCDGVYSRAGQYIFMRKEDYEEMQPKKIAAL